jgi:hypothetical protein
MSESDNSEESAITVPMKYVSTQSYAEEETEDEEPEESTMAEPTTLVTQEEIETMLKCTMRAIDSNSEIMNILIALNRMCDGIKRTG